MLKTPLEGQRLPAGGRAEETVGGLDPALAPEGEQVSEGSAAVSDNVAGVAVRATGQVRVAVTTAVVIAEESRREAEGVQAPEPIVAAEGEHFTGLPRGGLLENVATSGGSASAQSRVRARCAVPLRWSRVATAIVALEAEDGLGQRGSKPTVVAEGVFTALVPARNLRSGSVAWSLADVQSNVGARGASPLRWSCAATAVV